MAKARARTTARKTKDKWKAKQWYAVLSSDGFNKAPIAESPADLPDKMMGRIATTTMQELTGDFKLMHVKLDFQVVRVNGNQAETRFIGHSLTSDYLRRLVRRNHTKVTGVFDVTTKDGALIRVKPVAVADGRTQSSQQTLLRRLFSQTIVESASSQPLEQFVREMIDGRLAGKIGKACKPIYPLRKVEIYRSEVRQAPTITLADVQPAPAETPAESGDGGPAEAGPTEAAGGSTKSTETEEGAVEEEQRPVEVAPSGPEA